MNSFYVSFLVVVLAVLAVIANPASLNGPQSECPDICTFDYRPVCGFDGSCYHIYGNGCALKSDRCKRKSTLEMVPMTLCNDSLDVTKNSTDVKACVIPED